MSSEIILRVEDLDPDLAEAADRYAVLDVALADGDLFVVSTGAAIEWLYDPAFSEGTRDQYRRVYTSWLMWCKAQTKPVAPLVATRAHVERYVRDCQTIGNPALPPEKRRPLANSSLARHLAALSSYYQRAIEDERAERNPVPSTKHRPKANRESPQPYLELGQLRALIAAADQRDRDSALVALLLLACLRVSEALNADIGELGHWGKDRVLWVTRKGARRERVLLVPETYERVTRGAGDRARGPILATRTGLGLDRKTAWKNVRAVADRAGIDSPVGPHTLRHAYVTHGFELKIPVANIQRAAGHTSPTTTEHYDRRDLITADHPSRQIAASLIPRNQ